MFKELKENIIKGVKKGMMTISHQIENINKETVTRFKEVMDKNFQNLKKIIILTFKKLSEL